MNQIKPLDQVLPIGADAHNHVTKVVNKFGSRDSILYKLKEFSSSVPDFRRSDKGNIRHKLDDIIMLMILGRASGCIGRAEIIEFGKHNLNKFRKMGMLRNGVPSEATLCRVDNGIDDLVMAGHRRWFLKRSLLLITKAVVAGICGYLSFLIGSIVSIVLMIENNSLFIDWTPWMLTGFFIAFIISFQTDIKRKRALIGAFISIIFGLSSMYVWDNSQNALVDTRDDMLLSYMIYCVGFAISIAITFPKSECYFLRVEGPIKAMDIAIYKWINAIFHNRQFTIGKSINCDLQITWDLQSDIAPEIAEVKMKGGHLYLIALEEGVFTRKKEMKPNEKIRLYHGTHFRIGQTKFTYIERDI